MEYKGKLYGRVRGTYFEMLETTKDIDKIKFKAKQSENTFNNLLDTFIDSLERKGIEVNQLNYIKRSWLAEFKSNTNYEDHIEQVKHDKKQNNEK